MLSLASSNGVASAPGADHFVRFYDKDAELLEEVADHLDGALRVGGLAVAIGTSAHCAELSRRLGGFGGPLGKTSNWFSGRVVFLDAADTLDSFMVGGLPDPELFERAIAPVLAQVAPGKPVHAFGEMVGVLCERGEYDAAVALERLWNDLGNRHCFSLFCGYPRRLFSSRDKSVPLRHICAAHTRVDAFADPVQVDGAPSETLLRVQQQAAALQAEVERRKEAEQTLRHRERELADFLDNASEGIHKVASDGTILYANRAELEMLGYAWEEYVGHNIAEFYADPELIREILSRLQGGEVLRDQAAVLRCRDGNVKPVLIYSNGYFEAGELAYTRCFTRDASERVARDSALEQRDGLILQSPVAAALLCGPELRIDLANEAYCRMVGRSEIAGKTFAEAFPELRGSPTESLLQEVLRTGSPYSTDEHKAQLDFGRGSEERFFKLTLQPLRSPKGATAGVISVAVDITEQVRARQALEQAGVERERLLEDLREAGRAKDEFLAMLGHELRNPLSPIVTALQLMRMRGDPGTTREQGIIQRQVDHMVRLVDDLLDVSRITKGKIELKRERVQLSTVLAKAVEQASLLLEQRSHELRIDVDPELQCDCDPVRIAQVVSNLLTNSARYTEPGGQVTLKAWRKGDASIAIAVRDNGTGIHAAVLPRIFDLFYQGQRSIDRAEGGLGIGLALVRSLVALHGGSVEARSEGKGCGSEFTVTLPSVRSDEATGTAAAARQDSVRAGAAGRILLVDDNQDAAETLAVLLQHYDYEVDVFTDPVTALERLSGLQPDVAILDIGLPVLDGYELAARVRAACGPSCMLVALTGYGQESDRARSKRAGFDHHLVKPVPTEALLELLGVRRA